MGLINQIEDALVLKNGNDENGLKIHGDIDGVDYYSHLFVKEGSKNLYVILNGALEKKRDTSLKYHRWTWHADFPGHVLYIADPMLFIHNELNLAWYIGDKNHDAQINLSRLVLSIAAKLSIKTENIIAYGSSGGGFAALQLAAQIGQNMLAVCINPQTNVFQYDKSFVDCYLDFCWKGVSDLQYSDRFNAIERVFQNQCRVLYIQNYSDVIHFNRHFIPFMARFGIDESYWGLNPMLQNLDIKSFMYDHPSGHGPELKTMLPEILSVIQSF